MCTLCPWYTLRLSCGNHFQVTKLFFNINLYEYIHVITLFCAYHVDLVLVFIVIIYQQALSQHLSESVIYNKCILTSVLATSSVLTSQT